MPAKRIPQLTAISGASTANDDNLVIFDTDANETKRILRSQLAAGLVGDLPYTPSGGISATTVPTAIAELDSEAAKSAALAASSGSSLVGFLQAGTGAVTRTAQSKMREVVSVKDFGAVGDGVANDSDAIQAAIDAAALAVGGSTGAVVYFPTGTYLINKTINMPNRVGLQGANGRGVTIKALAPFTGAAMFYANNGTTSMFGSWINDMYLDSRGVNLASGVVVTDAWQETCGMTNVVISFDGTTPYGLLVQIGYGGAAYLPLRDLEIFSDSTVTSAAIRVSQISLVGGFVLSVDGLTAAGSLANPMDNAIYMENDSLYVKGLHCEYVDNMIAMDGAGSLSADTCTGSSVPVVDMVTIGSGFTGQVNLRNMIPNGATGNIFKNNITGLNIPASEYGMLASYDYQPSAFLATVGTQIDNVTGNGTEYLVVFDTEVYDYLGEYNTSDGKFTAARSGKYLLTCCLKMNIPAGSTTAVVRINTSNRAYEAYRGSFANQRDTSNNVTINGAVLADMDAGDVASVSVIVAGIGADTVDILASGGAVFGGQWMSR